MMWKGRQSKRYGEYGRWRCVGHNGEGKGDNQHLREWERRNDGLVDCTLVTSRGECLVQPTKDTLTFHKRLFLPGLSRDGAVQREARETMGGGGTNQEGEWKQKRERKQKNLQNRPYPQGGGETGGTRFGGYAQSPVTY
uniref:Uncharacterized protein n=1 Tax=Chromera velia CCMP2878 TaxID=1169474 RepID=A0A0G4F8Z5_9ALVE|eukprot:Cvel_15775.t1-p1 / transcript=Cvel_15775.t1 / gene=Cvel_15775 / organism=Chromera_velia_CCMP2878 / gene_product=hypothetical protein / transcript_product=hypothetical protein / location=Cvel_scaffold1183:17836-18249(+) / protein_length=138 / sequence_SO=supercontig / SO=protein_coding / is_pseudo=false